MNKINSKVASILFDEGIYKVPVKTLPKSKTDLDLHGKQDSVILCLFIRDDFSHPHDEELVLAENIMKAIKIEKGDYAWAYSKRTLENHNFQHSNVFIFHSGTIIDKTEFPLNEWLNIKNSRVLRTYSLSDLISDRVKKKQLWTKLLQF